MEKMGKKPLERKDRKSLKDVLEKNAKVTFHLIVFGLSTPYFPLFDEEQYSTVITSVIVALLTVGARSLLWEPF